MGYRDNDLASKCAEKVGPIKEKSIVFCINCENFNDKGEGYELICECNAPKNVVEKVDFRTVSEDLARKPKDINRKNNCEWFIPKAVEKSDIPILGPVIFMAFIITTIIAIALW